MMRISIQAATCDLPEQDLREMTQLGVDCLDFASGSSFPGVAEQGFPDLDKVLALKKKVRSMGMDINRVTLPDMTEAFMWKREGAEQQLANICSAMKVFGEAGMPFARVRFAGDALPHSTKTYKAIQRGGAIARGERAIDQGIQAKPDPAKLEHWWKRVEEVFTVLLPIAEQYGTKLAIHPTDTPYPGTFLDGIGMHRVMDMFPNKQVGMVYCVGTRAEAGGSSLVLDEIHQFGRKGRIFHVHVRNVRGSLSTAEAFEEAMLDEGDVNIPKVLMALRKVGYEGCLNPSHILSMTQRHPHDSHSNADWRNKTAGWAYSIGYLKAILAAMDEFAGY